MNKPFELRHGLPAEAVDKLNGVFRAWPQIDAVILYGSRAKGNYRTGSDIDLCIRAKALTLPDLLEIEDQIDELLLPWKVDLSLVDHIDNPALLDHIQRVGTVFYQKP